VHRAQMILADSIWPRSEYIHLSEVQDGTGYARSGAADGVIIPIWPSRGHCMIGIEIKVSRGDWLKELKQPRKADAFFKKCYQWYLVTMGKDNIAQPEEIPQPWGHIHISDEEKVRTKKKAPGNAAAKPLDNFVVSMLRNVQGNIAKQVDAAKQEAINKFYRERQQEIEKDTAELMRLKHLESQLGKSFQERNDFVNRVLDELNLNRYYSGIGQQAQEDRHIEKLKQAMQACSLLESLDALQGRLNHLKSSISSFEQSIQGELNHVKRD